MSIRTPCGSSQMKEFALRFDNARAALRHYGLLAYARRLTRHFLEGIWKRHAATVFRRELTQSVEAADPVIPLVIELYSAADNAALHSFLDPHVRRDVIESRLRLGWTPMLAWYRDKLVGVSWFSTAPLYLDSLERFMDYGRGAAYIEGTRTDRSFRGMGIAPAIRSRICRHLRQLGYTRVFVCVGDDNVSSRTVARKCGFVPHESIILTRMLWHRHYQSQKVQ